VVLVQLVDVTCWCLLQKPDELLGGSSNRLQVENRSDEEEAVHSLTGEKN